MFFKFAYLHNTLSSILQLLWISCSPSVASLAGRSSSRSEAESASLILLRRVPAAAEAPPTTTRPRQYGLFIEALLQKLIYWQGN